MRRLLFNLALAFIGYMLGWLLRDDAEQQPQPRTQARVIGYFGSQKVIDQVKPIDPYGDLVALDCGPGQTVTLNRLLVVNL